MADVIWDNECNRGKLELALETVTRRSEVSQYRMHVCYLSFVLKYVPAVHVFDFLVINVVNN